MLHFNHRFVAFGLFVLALLPAGSCDLLGLFGSPTVEAQLGSIFSLAMGQTARLSSEGLSIQFEAVLEDSRCPVDVQCVWAGNAKVSIQIQQTGQTSQTLILNSNLEPREVAYEAFLIRYEDLAPQPRSDSQIPRGKYRLSLSVSR